MNTCERSCGHLATLKDHSQFLKNGNVLCCSEEYMARLRQSCWIKTNSLNQDKYSNLSPCMPDCDVVIVLNGASIVPLHPCVVEQQSFSKPGMLVKQTL
jgi:hypothetical protein